MNVIESAANRQVPAGGEKLSVFHLSPVCLPVSCTPGYEAALAWGLAEMTGQATRAAAEHWARVAAQHSIRVGHGVRGYTAESSPSAASWNGSLHNLTADQLATLILA
ncbi:hypothetical protein ABJI51_05200 [Amycolatopsis sp. NEAU-NG30]|uniref:Uncharacterized protein n=1 Tax=Amycolatopsis melonis TaxID=3156488 RepID=A0ABV0L8F5_9PSEU